MKTQMPLLSALLMVSVVVLAQQNKIGPDGNPIPVDVTEVPYYHLLFENEFARAFRVELPPQKATLLHKHPNDYMVIMLTGGDVESARGIGSFMTYDEHRGATHFWHGPVTHRLRNPEGALTYRNVTVEIKRPSEQPYGYPSTPESRQDYDVIPPPLDSRVSYQAVLDRDTVRASSVQILPGESLVVAKINRPLLVVALEDLDLKAAGGLDLRASRDDVLWDPAAFHRKLTNTGSQPARFIFLEFK